MRKSILAFFIISFVIHSKFLFAQTKIDPLSTSPIIIGAGGGCNYDALTTNAEIRIIGINNSDQTKTDWVADNNQVFTYRIALPPGFRFANANPGDIKIFDSSNSPDHMQIGAHRWGPGNDKTKLEFDYKLNELSSGTEKDTISIREIEIECLVPGSYGYIYRVASTNAGSMVGNNPGDNKSHGFLDSRVYNPNPTPNKIEAIITGHTTSWYTYLITKVNSSTTNYSICGDTTHRFNFHFLANPNSNIKSYNLYEKPGTGGSTLVVTSTTNMVTYNPPETLNGTYKYFLIAEDGSGCRFGSDTITIESRLSPPPATFIESLPGDPVQHDTVFAKDADSKLLNGYMAYTNPAYEVVSYYAGYPNFSVVEALPGGSYLFTPAFAQSATFPIYYTAKYQTCSATYTIPHPFTVFDPNAQLPSFVNIDGGAKPPFCAKHGDIKFNISPPVSGAKIRSLYFYSYNNRVSIYNYPPVATTYPSSTTFYTLNTDSMVKHNTYAIPIYMSYQVGSDPTIKDTTAVISVFPQRGVKIQGLPRASKGSAIINDSTIFICGSDKDTLYTRFTPEKGGMEFYTVKNGTATKLTSTLGSAPVNDPYFRKMVPYDLFTNISKGDTGTYIMIKYKFPASRYNNQCPDSVIRTIKFLSPVSVRDSIIFPASKPYCMGEKMVLSINNYINSKDRYIWNFGDGSGDIIDSLQRKSYTYSRPGIYVLKFKTNLKNLSTGTCNNYMIDTVKIGAKPNADFDIYQNFKDSPAILISRAKNLGVNLDATPTNPDLINSWYWDLGNGITRSETKDSIHYTYSSIQRDPYKIVHVVKSGWQCVDTVTKYIPVFNIETPDTLNPYKEDFNDDTEATSWYSSGWYRRDTVTASWQNEVAHGNKIQSPAGDLSWITSGFPIDNSTAHDNKYKVTYKKNEISWVESPVFDLKKLDLAMVSLNTWANADDHFDAACLQYAIVDDSAFGKEAWTTLGTYNQGLNWYNSSSVVTMPGGSVNAWTDTNSTDWQYSAYRLNDIKTALSNKKKYVRFRIIFGSNNDNLPDVNFDGFAFDNFFIGHRNRKVLVEEFCDYQNYIADIDNQFNDNQAIRIQYHVSDFTNNDTINRQNRVEPGARSLLYGIGASLPREVIDGLYIDNNLTHTDNQMVDWSKDAYFKRSLVLSPFSIKVIPIVDKGSGKVKIKTEITRSPTETSQKNYVVQVAVVEKKVNGNVISPGNTLVFTNVLRSLLPDAAGKRFDKSFSWAGVVKDSMNWIPFRKPESGYIVVAFIQDEDTKEIYQAGYDSISYTDAKFLKTNRVTGIANSNVSFNEVSLSPNPTSGEIRLNFNGILNENYKWTIVDALGNEMKVGELPSGINAVFLNTQDLSSGMYYLQIEGEGQRTVKKFSVMK